MKWMRWKILTDESEAWINENIKDWKEHALAMAFFFFMACGFFAFGLSLFISGNCPRSVGTAIVVGMISGTVAGRDEIKGFQRRYEKAKKGE